MTLILMKGRGDDGPREDTHALNEFGYDLKKLRWLSMGREMTRVQKRSLVS